MKSWVTIDLSKCFSTRQSVPNSRKENCTNITVLLQASVVCLSWTLFHSSTLSSPNMKSRTGEVAEEGTINGLDAMTSVWETTKVVGIPHLGDK